MDTTYSQIPTAGAASPTPIGSTGGTGGSYIPPCPGCGLGGASGSFSGIIPAPQRTAAGQRLPTLEEIASYNYISPNRSNPPLPNIPMQGNQGAFSNDRTPGGLSRTPMMSPDGTTVEGASLQYLNGFIRTQIGRKVRVDFLIGTNTLVDKTGILLGVGANYILINEIETDDLVACDFYNIKFIQFYY